jgi:REP element-mobilizing transposase RayT
MSIHRPLAYHITFGTYGTRLHGDERGTVDRSLNQPGDPIIGSDWQWEQMDRNRLNFLPRIFTAEQMVLVESLIPDICVRGGWTLHACATGPDHVHNVLTGDADGDVIRKILKRWLGQALCRHIPLSPGETFWAECGSVKWIWDEEYLARATRYVHDQRATGRGRA